MDNFEKIVKVGFKVFAAFAAGYFVHRMVHEPAKELTENGGTANALLIGAGEGAIITSVATLAYHIV
ncbi:MAG: hypothetical protein PHX43_05325 [Alphaproteobacteria bacterium]|nr:hypothetical protein [Alphaproteobacteria bacterium]